MDKQDLLYELRRNQNILAEKRREKKDIEEKLDTLEVFSRECAKRVQGFQDSMARRRQRLTGISALFTRVRSAALYSQRVKEALYGQDYAKTTASIDALQGSVSGQRKVLTTDLLRVEEEIERLENRVAQLQYEYNHYPEEDAEDGQ